MPQLSEHFHSAEFACHGIDCCGHSAPIDSKLIQALEILREGVRTVLGAERALIISSGFRCQRHNPTVSKNPLSWHTFGRAADIFTPLSLTPQRFFKIAEEYITNCGIGLYPWGIHVDIGGERRWSEI